MSFVANYCQRFHGADTCGIPGRPCAGFLPFWRVQWTPLNVRLSPVAASDVIFLSALLPFERNSHRARVLDPRWRVCHFALHVSAQVASTGVVSDAHAGYMPSSALTTNTEKTCAHVLEILWPPSANFVDERRIASLMPLAPCHYDTGRLG